MTAPTFVLASQSPARLGVLRAAGLDPVVRVSGVDEPAVLAALARSGRGDDADRLAGLAAAKADAVLPGLTGPAGPGGPLLVLGCDSMLRVGGELVGKPRTPEAARARWSQMSGRAGELLTGHALVRVGADGSVAARAAATRTTRVVFADVAGPDVDAYVATGEPLEVAGAFTLDGYGGWFVDRIEGDPSNVIGVSLPLLRALLTELGVPVRDLWRAPA